MYHNDACSGDASNSDACSDNASNSDACSGDALQSWMTIKKTEISAQHEFLKPIYLCVHRGIVLIYLDVLQKC